MGVRGLFGNKINVINIGIEHFANSLREQEVNTIHVAWRPPAGGDKKILKLLEAMQQNTIQELIEGANKKVLEMMLAAEPYWVGIKPAIDAVKGMKKNTILHSGPPIEWERMSKVQKNGIIGGILHEGLAKNEKDALSLVQNGEIDIQSANDLGVAGAGVGIVTPSMVVNICRDKKTGKEGYCIPFEGRVGLGVWGVYNDEVESNLQMIEKVMAPAIDHVLEQNGGINVKNIIAQGMQMGDETHTRQTAEGLLLVGKIVPMLIKADLDKKTLIRCVDAFTETERWFHPIGISSSICILSSIKDIEYSTVVTAIAANGVEIGIKISALGEEWFTAPAPIFTGKYFSPSWGPQDAMPMMGDSYVTEAVGMGGFAAAASPAVIRLRGGTIEDAVRQTNEMKEICIGINSEYPIPLLEFTGPPIGIDIRKVLKTGITPINHGGIISKEGGQIGAGVVRHPIDNFKDALHRFAEKYGIG